MHGGKTGQFEILSALRDFKKQNRKKYGIEEIGIFGSAARNTRKEGSDIDVIVKLECPDLFCLIGIKQELEEILRSPIDIVHYREKMNAFLKSRIDKDAIYA